MKTFKIEQDSETLQADLNKIEAMPDAEEVKKSVFDIVEVGYITDLTEEECLTLKEKMIGGTFANVLIKDTYGKMFRPLTWHYDAGGGQWQSPEQAYFYIALEQMGNYFITEISLT